MTKNFPIFHSMIKTQVEESSKKVRSDNGKEYFNQILISFFQKQGIFHESSCIDTPQQKGIVECKNRHP